VPVNTSANSDSYRLQIRIADSAEID